MSSLFSSLFIDPVVRQGRRFSTASLPRAGSTEGAAALSHVNLDVASTAPGAPSPPHAHTALCDATAGEDPADQRQAAAASPSQLSPVTPSAPIDIPVAASMSTNPERALGSPFRRLQLDAAPSQTLPERQGFRAADGGSTAKTSEALPADDGMQYLRARIIQITKSELPEQEKARIMHSIMTERYNLLRPQSPSSIISNERPFTPMSGQSVFSEVQLSSPMSAVSDVDPENPFNLRPGDTDPTYWIRPYDEYADIVGDDRCESAEDDVSFGCAHYKRNVKVQCHACRRWYTCRICHDAVEDHKLDRPKTRHMMCMACGTPQHAAQNCAKCGLQSAWYYCGICKLWDDDNSKSIYHCDDCGICRKGEGLGKDFIHCKGCNACIDISRADTHKCLENAVEGDCPICGEYLSDSSSAAVSMPCGHYLHKGCYKAYMETAYKCPVCKKSAVNMELEWKKLTDAIESQPMPEEFENTRVIIKCNDCHATSSVKYHWIGNKCGTCDSYNTNEVRMLTGPESEREANAIISADGGAARSPVNAASPSSVPLRSPRYYFQPDQPEGTWLPGQLPSLPFQMPQFPGMPQLLGMPQFPGMPQFRGMPQFPNMPQIPYLPGMLPNLPGMPQMPDPHDLLERVSRSFAYYLNPSEEIADEHVPIIDLGDEPRETTATDGSTVRQPSLPQYVLERFSKSFLPIRNYLTPVNESIPNLDLAGDGDGHGITRWGEDGRRVNRFWSGSEDEEDDESGSEGSEEEEEDDEEEADEEDAGGKEFELPWKP